VRARLGKGAGSASTASAGALTTLTASTAANLGITTTAFAEAWNAWAKSKYSNAASTLNVDKLRTAGPGSTAKLNFDFGIEMTVTVTTAGLVERVQLKLNHAKAVTRNDVERSVLVGALQGAAMDCLFAATSPGTDVDAIRRELGGVAGTTTSAVHEKVRFGFTQKTGENEPEFITAEPVGTSIATSAGSHDSAPIPQPSSTPVQRNHGMNSYFCFNGVRCQWNQVCCPGSRVVCASETNQCEKATSTFQTRVGFRCNRFNNEPCAAEDRCVFKQTDPNDPLSVTSACEPQ